MGGEEDESSELDGLKRSGNWTWNSLQSIKKLSWNINVALKVEFNLDLFKVERQKLPFTMEFNFHTDKAQHRIKIKHNYNSKYNKSERNETNCKSLKRPQLSPKPVKS